MIFEFSIGSMGVSREAYSIRIPFTPAPGRKLDIGEGVGFTLENLRVEIVPERYFYALTIGEFASEAAAAAWLNRASVALLWMIVKFRVGLTFDSAAEPLKLYDKPMPIGPASMLFEVVTASGVAGNRRVLSRRQDRDQAGEQETHPGSRRTALSYCGRGSGESDRITGSGGPLHQSRGSARESKAAVGV